jgi:predicted PurR-regulated permease PerM
MIQKAMNLSPLKNRQEKLLLANFINTSRATLKGSLVVAILQGILSGIILWIAGIPSAVLLGVISFFVSLIPFAGPALILVPIGVISLFLGNIWQGIVLIVFAILVVSTIDNFIRPKLVEEGSGLHPLLVFLSTLGGIALFGIAGFLLGPVIMVLLITLLDIYRREFKVDLKKFNQ